MASSAETVRLTVELGARSYPIVIGDGLLGCRQAFASPGRPAHPLTGRTVFVLSDENVAPLYLETFRAGAGDAAARIRAWSMPAGEAHKELRTFSRVLDELVACGAQRDAVLVTLGGGVVGDLGGFAAACYMRGIAFVQCPTTLLAQVDSSVGGKTGVNHPRGKNLIGAFHQPEAVLIDVATLATLDAREYAAGLAETVKYGVLGAPGFFPWLERHAEALLHRDRGALVTAVRRACETKAAIVAADEREQGVRTLLNLGHTFGHAIETTTGYTRYLHGEAVAIGMGLAADLAVSLGRCAVDVPERVRRLLERFGLPVSLPGGLPPQRLWDAMQLDKKNRAGRVRLILPTAIGAAEIADGVPAEAVLAVLAGRAEALP